MKLPPIHNTRSPQQWEIISKHIDFKDKTVIDLGCGYGDILFRCWQAGANCMGIDKDDSIFFNRGVSPDVVAYDSSIFLTKGDVENLGYPQRGFNVTVSFSVLPYLKEPALVLQWMRIRSDISLIECQYFGDGPGFDFIKNDQDMGEWLEDVGWQSVEMIGKTLVEGRNKERGIWLCR